MPEWLSDAFHVDPLLPLSVLAVRLVVALALGCMVAGIYRATHGKANGQSLSLMATLVMLTVLIAVVTLVIGENQARAFSLVGALAIIRFRTVVEDTRDTAFVIFAVAVGMAAGAGYLVVALVGVPIVALAAFLFRPRDDTCSVSGSTAQVLVLIVRIGMGHDPEALLKTSFDKHLNKTYLRTTTTARQGAAFELTYAVELRRDSNALTFVRELHGVEGVQSVELRQA